MKYLKAFVIWLLQATIGLVLLGFIVLMIAEWSAGCGETYVDSKGVQHANECIFLDWPKDKK
jgi:hypothetical protein